MDIHWDAELSSAVVWQREALILEVRAKGSGISPYARLITDDPSSSGMDVIPLPEENTAAKGAEQRRMTRRWKLIPHQPGKQIVDVGEVYYQIHGDRPATWNPSPLMLTVKALPPYLSPSFPVGELTMQADYQYDGWLSPGEVATMQLNIGSDTVTQAQFPDVLRQISFGKNLQLLPARVNLETTEEGRFIADYSIPLKSKRSGRLSVPRLEWQWFNPQTARIERAAWQPPRPWVLATWQWLLAGIFALLTLLIVSRQFYLHERSRTRRWQSRNLLWQALRQQQGVRQAMKNCSRSHGWPQTPGIARFLQHWQATYGQDRRLEHALQDYERKRFSRSADAGHSVSVIQPQE